MTQFAEIHQAFNSLISIEPLVSVLKKMIAEGRPGAQRLYQPLLKEIESKPDLLKPLDNMAPFIENSELVETLLSTIFPPSTADDEGLYAIFFPFRHETIYASPGFRDLLLTDKRGIMQLPDAETTVNINKALLNLAYHVILKKLYGYDVPASAASVQPFTNTETGIIKYLELELNAQFVTVKLLDEAFDLPPVSLKRSLDTDELIEILPLDKFQFEGFVVMEVTDVTKERVIAALQHTLQQLDGSENSGVFKELQQHIETLLALQDIQVGITPFYKLKGMDLYADSQYANSILYKHQKVSANTEAAVKICRNIFRTTDYPVYYKKLTESKGEVGTFLKYYADLGMQSLIICPLKKEEGTLIGLLEIGSVTADTLRTKHLSRLQPAMPLFAQALEKSIENLELQIDKTIKEHFTAIQNAVEWKFTEMAFQYLQNKRHYESVKMGNIVFEDVYPLYGSIDIRNSSVERNNAIQLDILEQLKLVQGVLELASKKIAFPLLQEFLFKVEQFINTTAEQLLSEEEMMIYDFLQQDIEGLFQHLSNAHPELKKTIDAYFGALDKQRNLIYHHRKDYEDSITKINDALDRFMDVEQLAAQKAFPHYFERYVTDGVEFNIYVGQSLAPTFPFSEIYVKNLKLWQITMLAKAARLTHALEKQLPLALQTTQLILAHSTPLTISFRRKERKFDVDGAYNIRYEIVKKRIDKVHLKDSEERLTQPGKIAVVYSQQKELNEYLEFISFLQSEGLLTDNIEHMELEDTQGISGLKGIRVEVAFNDATAQKPALSEVTSEQLLKR